MTAHPSTPIWQAAAGWCRDAAYCVSTALREIFDEAAYARFLARTGQSSSRAAYAGFLRERAASHERRPRCC